MVVDLTGFHSLQLKKRELKTIFQKLELEVRSSNHVYGWLVIDGKKILRVHHSFGKGDIPPKVIEKIRGQLKLNQQNFRDLVQCPLSKEGYLDILKEKNYI